jgi:hypothetical protein
MLLLHAGVLKHPVVGKGRLEQMGIRKLTGRGNEGRC